MLNRLRLLLILTTGLVFAAHVAQAHHAIAANYDISNIGTIEGVVVEVFWANPHVHYYIEVINNSGETELWDIETSNLISMMRSNWTRETIEVGDYIRISGSLGRDKIRRMLLDLESLEIIE